MKTSTWSGVFFVFSSMSKKKTTSALTLEDPEMRKNAHLPGSETQRNPNRLLTPRLDTAYRWICGALDV